MKKIFALFLVIVLGLTSISSWAAEDEEAPKYTPYIDGYEDNTFRPENPISIAEAIALVSRLSTESNVVQKDYSYNAGDSWYKEYIEDLGRKGFLNIFDQLTPDRDITRAEMASLVYQLKQMTCLSRQ